MIKKLRAFDAKQAQVLVNDLRKSRSDAKTFADELDKVISSREISSKIEVQLVDWCDIRSTDNRGPAREIARKISVLLYGKVIDEFD